MKKKIKLHHWFFILGTIGTLVAFLMDMYGYENSFYGTIVALAICIGIVGWLMTMPKEY